MTVRIFAIGTGNTWLHAYEVDPSAVNGMPNGGELYGVDGTRYVVNGTTLQAAGPNLTPTALDKRLLAALTSIEGSLGTRIDHYSVDDAERAARLKQARELLAAIRAKSDPDGRFTVMRPVFTHWVPALELSPGGWLHNLFCH